MMRKIIFLVFLQILLITTGKSACSQTPGGFDYYKSLNDAETRLAEYRDSDEELKLKLQQLDIINGSRKKYRAEPVALDILASRVANKMCREAAQKGYVSHWNLSGEKPYHRYAFAGGYDHVSENAYGEWTSGKYNISGTLIASLMKNGHQSFMSEKAPRDGHKKNIINRPHNYVGIGFFITENQFRYYEEFIDRYLEFGTVPSKLLINEEGIISVNTKGESFLYFLICYRENLPVPVKPGQKPRTGTYEDFSAETALRIPAWDLARYRTGTQYNIPVVFKKEGLYYVQLFIDKKEITTPRAITTKGYYPVSGIVIRVAGREFPETGFYFTMSFVDVSIITGNDIFWGPVNSTVPFIFEVFCSLTTYPSFIANHITDSPVTGP